MDMTSELPPERPPAKSDSQSDLDSTVSTEVTAAPLANARTFLLAGKAVFTLQGVNSRYTYKIVRKDASGSYLQDVYFVFLLTGPDNTSEYTYLGILDSASGQVRLTRKSTYRDDSTPVVAIRWALKHIWAERPLPTPAAILHAGRCGRCGRLLTVPESILSGFGPECAGRI